MLGIRNAAKAKGVDPDTVKRAIRSGDLAAKKINGRYHIDPKDLAQWRPRPAHRPARGRRKRMRVEIMITKDRERLLERAARPGESIQQVLERLAFDRCRSCTRCPRCGEARDDGTE